MANDGRVSASQQHVEYLADGIGVLSSALLHAEYLPAGIGVISSAMQHVEYLPAGIGTVSSMLLMVEYSDEVGGAVLVQGEFLFKTPFQGAVLRRSPPWQIA